MSESMHIFTDGACQNNGKPHAKAGIGIYFGDKDPRNVSKRVSGKQTNNTAELSAIIEVFPLIQSELHQDHEIIIYTDSQYAIWCATTYGRKCEQNKWIKKKGVIPNVELVKQLYGLATTYPQVKFHHVKAHTGLSDELSMGNECADRLATESIGIKQFTMTSPFTERTLVIGPRT